MNFFPLPFDPLFDKEHYLSISEVISSISNQSLNNLSLAELDMHYINKEAINVIEEKFQSRIMHSVLLVRNTTSPIHTDGSTLYALNIPLLNCDSSSTRFYRIKPGHTHCVSRRCEEFHWASKLANIYDTADVVFDEEYIVTAPVVVRTDVPHNASVRGNTPRVLLTIRFEDCEIRGIDEIYEQLTKKP